jgi:hypothetical protein
VIAARETHAVRWDELAPATSLTTRAKGDDGEHWPIAVALAGGVRAPIADELGMLVGARVGIEARDVTGWTVTVDAASRTDGGTLRESSLMIGGGYRVGIERGPLRAWLGGELAAGMIRQSVSGASSASPEVALAPLAGVSLAVTSAIAITLEAQVPFTLLQRDDKTAVVPLPAGWIGVVVRP